MIIESQLKDGTQMLVPGIVPKLSQTPGTIRSAAPELGAHTAEILNELGISAEMQTKMRERGVI